MPATAIYSSRARAGVHERPLRPDKAPSSSRELISRYSVPVVPVEQSRREATAEEHVLMPRILRATEVFLAALGKTQATCNNYINHLKRLYIRDGWCPDYMATDEYRATIFRDPVNKAHSQYPCSALKLFQQFWIQRVVLEDLPEEDRPAYQVDRPNYGPTGDMPRLRWSRSRAGAHPGGQPSTVDEIRRANEMLDEEAAGGVHTKRQRITELSPEEIEAEEAAQQAAAQSSTDQDQEHAAKVAAQQLAAAKFAAAQAARASAAQLVVHETDDVLFRRGGAYAGQAYPSGTSSALVAGPRTGALLPAELPSGTVHKSDHINKIREAARALWAYRRGEGPAPVTAAAMLAAKKRIDRAKIKEQWAESRSKKMSDLIAIKERREEHLKKMKDQKISMMAERQRKAQDAMQRKAQALRKKSDASGGRVLPKGEPEACKRKKDDELTSRVEAMRMKAAEEQAKKVRPGDFAAKGRSSRIKMSTAAIKRVSS